jgi:threonine dehydratase
VTATRTSDRAALRDKAREIVAAALSPMPLVGSPGLGQGVLLKLESVQPTVSFKVRGALAALSLTGNTGGIVTITVNLIRQHIRRLISLTEEHIGDATRHLASEHGLIAEGAGAAPRAAILAGTIPVTGQTVAIISGRNITLRALALVQTG